MRPNLLPETLSQTTCSMNGSQRSRTVLLCVIVASAALAIGSAPATAHDTSTEDGYDVMFGGSDEPIITGERQWFEIHITDAESEEPIEDVGNLTVSVQQSGSDEVYEADAGARHGEPGWYEAPIFFTEPGDYAVTIEGTIDGTEIKTTFQKTVDDPDDLQYPASEDAGESSALGSGFGTLVAIGTIGLLGAILFFHRD